MLLNWGASTAASSAAAPARLPTRTDRSAVCFADASHASAHALRRPTGSHRQTHERQASYRYFVFLLRPAPGPAGRARSRRILPLHPDPGADPADHPARPRRRRPGPDRHRQDPGLPDHGDEPPADPPGAGRAQARGPARADPGADPRAGDPDPQGRGQVRRRPRPEVRAGLRRRRLRQAARSCCRTAPT